MQVFAEALAVKIEMEHAGILLARLFQNRRIFEFDTWGAGIIGPKLGPELSMGFQSFLSSGAVLDGRPPLNRSP
jgi:hypothetical protein